MTSHTSLAPTPAARQLSSVASVIEQFTAVDYVCNKETATAVFLMVQLQRPLLVEGPPGVGKTELAKVLAQTTEAQSRQVATQMSSELLATVLTDDELRERMGRRSLEIIEGWNYDVDTAAIVRAVELASGGRT